MLPAGQPRTLAQLETKTRRTSSLRVRRDREQKEHLQQAGLQTTGMPQTPFPMDTMNRVKESIGPIGSPSFVRCFFVLLCVCGKWDRKILRVLIVPPLPVFPPRKNITINNKLQLTFFLSFCLSLFFLSYFSFCAFDCYLSLTHT